MNIDNLIERLEKAKYHKQGYNFAFDLLGDEQKAVAKEIIYGWAAEQISDVELNKKCAELEAKCYAYEKIIANSNFAPMMQGKPKVERKARWILHTIENDAAIACSNCLNVIQTFEGFESKEKARQAAKGAIECGALKLTNYCPCCGSGMEIDI